ncbi:MAG: exodeoxyribonuclease VII large subunit [Planctomycetota bacterium]
MNQERRRLFGYAPPGTPPAERRRALTVSELNARAREIERGFGEVARSRELSGLYSSGSGHLYFTLKDEKAEISCVMWRTRAQALTFRPGNGDAVEVRGRLSLYEPKGRFQLVADAMDPAGLGELERRFRELKERYRAAGWFDEERKRPLPFLPRRIGIVTSARGAAVRDLLTTIFARFPRASVLVADARVQGAGAAAEIADAVARLDGIEDVDVIVVGRGGGSLEDLWAFNEPAVVEALHRAVTPIVSAVGHEVDFTLADFVADLRAPTPTAAGERVVPDLGRLLAQLDADAAALDRRVRGRVRAARTEIEALARSWALREPASLVGRAGQRLDDLAGRLRRALAARAERASRGLRESERRLQPALLAGRAAAAAQSLALAERALGSAVGRRLEREGRRLDEAERLLGSLSPLTVLSRGYSITRDLETGRILRRADEAAPGARIATRLAEGEVRSRVEAPEPPRDATGGP